jgi:hypothetical protein
LTQILDKLAETKVDKESANVEEVQSWNLD